MVVVVRSFCYGGCCEVLSLWSLLSGPFIMVVDTICEVLL